MEENIIVLSDDDDCTTVPQDDSVLIVEENENNRVAEVPKSSEILDEDLTITYSQKAHVLPHARYDCTIPFCCTESVLSGPENNNAAYCEQCFCYVCDKPASKCNFWTIPGFCHCNAHKRSIYWKSLRDKNVLGYLGVLNFPFDPQDMDSDLRRAEASLQQFTISLAIKHAAYMAGFQNPNQIVCSHHANFRKVNCEACTAQQHLQLSYLEVKNHVCTFLDEAMKQTPKTCVVMLLGAVKLFITHSSPGNSHIAGIISDVKQRWLWRVTSKVQTLFVMVDFPATFIKQLEHFYQSLPLPPDCKWLRNSLNVLMWEDPLLSAVLKGQNITGDRRIKGKRTEALFETIIVVQARVCKLQQEKRYRELARYLKVVRSDSNPVLQMMKDWIPLYLCKVGDFISAVDAMFTGTLCASRLSPLQFGAYIRILISGHAPSEIPQPPQLDFVPHSGVILESQSDPLLSSDWTAIEGGNKLLKRLEVLKFALRVVNCNSVAFTDPESWVRVLNIANIPSNGVDGDSISLVEPDLSFLIRTRDNTVRILGELTRTSRVQIPKNFQQEYPDQAVLLLATQALATRILHSRLCPILNVIMTFKMNAWALRWLFRSLVVRPNVLQDLLCVVVEELWEASHKPFLQNKDTLGQFLIASFLCLFFMEGSIVLDPNSYPISALLTRWNESNYPWQYYLREQLEYNEAILQQDKQRILQIIKCGLPK